MGTFKEDTEFLFLFLISETRSRCVDQAPVYLAIPEGGLEALLASLPECWGYRCVLPQLVVGIFWSVSLIVLDGQGLLSECLEPPECSSSCRLGYLGPALHTRWPACLIIFM